MFKNNKLLLISIVLLVISVITWQLGNYISAPNEMDEGTSFAIVGFIGTAFFLLTTLILSLISLLVERNRIISKNH